MTDFTAQALEEFVTETQTLLDGALAQTPRDADVKDEISFWRRQRQAYINARADYELGRRLIPTETGYLAPSASHPGQFHRCWKAGGVWLCTCPAGERGHFHRHTALISAYERGAELALLAEERDESELEALEDRAAAADILADAAAERDAQALDDAEARRRIAAAMCAARSRIAA
jgi:hypothetical protein